MICKLAAVLFFSVFAVVEAVIARDIDYVDEGLFLARCTTFEKIPGTSSEKAIGTSSIICYNQYIDRPNAMFYAGDPIAPTGENSKNTHIDWTSGTAQKPITSMIWGSWPFKVWDLTAEGDPKTNATGYARFNEKDMRCYRANDYMNTLWATPLTSSRVGRSKFTDCKGEYICTRAERKIRRTRFEFSEDTLDVGVTVTENPSEPNSGRIRSYLTAAFGDLERVYKPEVIKSSGTIDIQSADAKLKVGIEIQEVKSDPTFESRRMLNLQNELSKKLVDRLFAEKGSPKCTAIVRSKYNSCVYTIKFPKQIYIAIQVADQQDLRWEPKDEITITAVSTQKGKCEQNRKAMEALSGLFGGVAEIKGGWVSAAAGGLGFLLGAIGEMAC